ncbi:EF-hand calcium-binding domain-containing [Argiope bruennichi]|uniref:EF-hand calcium-binding domain-containing n=1 Tax=Argiope bruennichi TaxID=94029 RepID=A0A8T0ET03_ARGBR|nr:EF-hand calcium-binding domain-containing [Argiope bruennichi]
MMAVAYHVMQRYSRVSGCVMVPDGGNWIWREGRELTVLWRLFQNGLAWIILNFNLFSLVCSEIELNVPNYSELFLMKSLNKFLKGVLFHVDGDMLSYRYQLEVLENTVVEIFVTAITDKGETTPNIPVEVLIFQDGKNKTFITSSSFLNEDGFCTVKYALKKGKYILIPILLKWDMLRKSNSFDRLNLDSLIHVEEDSSVILTSACERSLKTIFDCIDLDENGLLNPTEFDYFIRHVSGETAAEEWNTVEDNFKTENQQLTFEGFVELYRLVLQTDPTDVMSMLQHMGMNETLELENSHSRVKIRLDCSKSVNCASHYGRLDFTFNVLPRTCITGHHLFPVDPSKEWTVECTEYLL